MCWWDRGLKGKDCLEVRCEERHAPRCVVPLQRLGVGGEVLLVACWVASQPSTPSPPVSREQGGSEVPLKRMRRGRARAHTSRAPRDAPRPLGRASAPAPATSGWCPLCRWGASCASPRRGRAPEWLGRALLGRAAAASFGHRPGYRWLGLGTGATVEGEGGTCH